MTYSPRESTPIVQIATGQRPARTDVVVRPHELLAGVELVRDRRPIDDSFPERSVMARAPAA